MISVSREGGARRGRDRLYMTDANFLRGQARKCRRLAAMVTTRDVVETLLEMAAEYERRADALEPEPGEEGGSGPV